MNVATEKRSLLSCSHNTEGKGWILLTQLTFKSGYESTNFFLWLYLSLLSVQYDDLWNSSTFFRPWIVHCFHDTISMPSPAEITWLFRPVRLSFVDMFVKMCLISLISSLGVLKVFLLNYFFKVDRIRKVQFAKFCLLWFKNWNFWLNRCIQLRA